MTDRPAVAALRAELVVFRAEWERVARFGPEQYMAATPSLISRLLTALERVGAALEAPGPQSAVEAAAQALGGLAGRQRRERGEAPPLNPATETEAARIITAYVQDHWGDHPALTIEQVLNVGDVLAPLFVSRGIALAARVVRYGEAPPEPPEYRRGEPYDHAFVQPVSTAPDASICSFCGHTQIEHQKPWVRGEAGPADDDSPNSLQPQLAALRARGGRRVNMPGGEAGPLPSKPQEGRRKTPREYVGPDALDPTDHQEGPAASSEPSSEEARLRWLLWLRHGCPIGALYGDDGEMTCGICIIDFKRWSTQQIERKFRAK